jgi:hypothetical protein
VPTSRIVSCAGAIASVTAWAALAERWRLILRRHGLDYLSVREAMTFTGEFRNKAAEWGDAIIETRDALVYDLGALAERYGLTSTGHVCEVAETALAVTVDKRRSMFEGALASLVDSVGAEGAVALVCNFARDGGHEYQPWLSALRSSRGAPMERVISLSYMDHRFVEGLQYVEMLAWLLRSEVERVLDGQPATMQTMLYNQVIQDSDAHAFDRCGRPIIIGNLL